MRPAALPAADFAQGCFDGVLSCSGEPASRELLLVGNHFRVAASSASRSPTSCCSLRTHVSQSLAVFMRCQEPASLTTAVRSCKQLHGAGRPEVLGHSVAAALAASAADSGSSSKEPPRRQLRGKRTHQALHSSTGQEASMPRTAAGLDSVKKSRPASTSAGSTLLQPSGSARQSPSARHWLWRHPLKYCASPAVMLLGAASLSPTPLL